MELNVKLKHIIKAAKEEAEKSTYMHKVGAVIFKGDRVISTGYNSVRSSRRTPRTFKKFLESLHAECRAITSARQDLRGYSIMVIRCKNDKLNLAKPCQFCEDYIRYVGIKKIYYSNEFGNIELMKV